MKKSFIAAVLLATPLFAHAYTTWQDTINFNPAHELSTFQGYTFTHNLTNDGFNPGVDTISNYNLKIGLHNGTGRFDSIYIDQPGLKGDNNTWLFNWTAVSVTTGDSYKGVADLNANGLLDVSVYSLAGNFYLDSSTLTAEGTQGATHPVPEPSSVALLAAGLLGIAVMRRKSKNAA